MTFKCPKGHDSTDPEYCSECGTPILAARTLGTDASSSQSAASMGGPAECPDCMTPRTPGARFCEVCRHDFEADARPVAPQVPPPVAMPVRVPDPVPPAVHDETPPAEPVDDPVADLVPPEAAPSEPAPTAPEEPVTETPTTVPMVAPPTDGTVTEPHRFRDPWAVVRCDVTLAPVDAVASFPADEPVRSFPLDLDGMTMGRRRNVGANPEVPLRDPAASGRHLRVNRLHGGVLQVLDVNSSNGTSLNGVPMEPGVAVDLSPGDELTLGTWTRIRIEDR